MSESLVAQHSSAKCVAAKPVSSLDFHVYRASRGLSHRRSPVTSASDDLFCDLGGLTFNEPQRFRNARLCFHVASVTFNLYEHRDLPLYLASLVHPPMLKKGSSDFVTQKIALNLFPLKRPCLWERITSLQQFQDTLCIPRGLI